MKNFIFILLIILGTSCSKIMGLRKPISISSSNIEIIKKKYSIPQTLICDSNYAYSLKKDDSSLIQKHLQPLQAIYFDRKGKNIAYYLNCNVQGFPNLKWNVRNTLNNFPPVYTDHNDSLTLKEIFSALKFKDESSESYDYTILLFWNDFMGKQTKIFLNEFRKNLSLVKQESVKVIYINNDNLFIE